MSRGYKTYAEAIRNRKSDEITIFDPVTGLYHNIKVFHSKNPWIGSPW